MWGETALTTIEQVNRWLCQPAVIPITAICGETREYLLSNVLRTIHIRIRHRIALLAHVQATFNTLVVICVAARRTRLRRIAFGHQLNVDAFRFRLVVQKRRESVERPPVQVEISVVAPIPRLTCLVIVSDTAEVANDKCSDASFDAHLYDCFRECVQEVCPATSPLPIKTSRLTGRGIVALGFFLREVVFVFLECATGIQHRLTAEGDGGEVAYPEINTGNFVARWFRVYDGATNELKPPLVAFVDGANLLNVSLGQVNIRSSLVLTQDEVRTVFFEVTAFREANTGELCIMLEASRFERYS